MKDLMIRSSAEEFLTFKVDEKEKGIQVRYENETLWMTQKAMAELFDVGRPAITKHLNNIFKENELDKGAVCSKMEHTAEDGKKYQTDFYNLDAIISVGYRVNSVRATQFRRWATGVLRTFTIQGYVLDKERMKNGSFINQDYFEKLLAEIREIRLSERRFYQKITDIYATSIDYDRNSPTTIKFFNGKILETDVVIAKNYLSKEEIEGLELIVSSFLDLAESRARRNIPMTMEDWSNLLDKYLLLDNRDILKDAGKISKKIACDKALSEFEKYRVKQDRLYKSDFDLLLEEVQSER